MTINSSQSALSCFRLTSSQSRDTKLFNCNFRKSSTSHLHLSLSVTYSLTHFPPHIVLVFRSLYLSLQASLNHPLSSISYSVVPQSETMPPLRAASGSLARACSRQQLPAARPAAVTLPQQRRGRADAASTSSSFESPFGRSKESQSTLKIPSFKKYASSNGETSNKVFSYFMAGSMGLITAVGAKATVQGGLFFRIREVLYEAQLGEG